MVKPYQDFKELVLEIGAAEGLVAAEKDEEMKAYAEEELTGLRAREQELRAKLEDMLLVDPAEDFDSIIMEIRAGTGGDEAALFAGDLYDMYTHYARTQGWTIEDLDFNSTEHGRLQGSQSSASAATASTASSATRAAAIACSACPRPRRRAASTPPPRPWPSCRSRTRFRSTSRPRTCASILLRRRARRAARQQDRERGTLDAHPDGHRRREPGRAQPAQEQGPGCACSARRLYEALKAKEHAARAAERKSLIGSGDRTERIRTYNFPQNRVTDHRINLNLYKLDYIIMGDLGEIIRALMDYDKKQRLDDLSGPAKKSA